MSLRLVFAAAAVFCAAAMAAPQPIERFARRPQMHGVTISANGRYVAFLSGVADDTVLMTLDRNTGGAFKKVTTSEAGRFDIGWCRWANESRLLCGLYGNIRGKKYAEPPFKRLFAVDANGTALKVLEQTRNEGNLLAATAANKGAMNNKSIEDGLIIGIFRAERQDNVIDLTPDDPDTVLIQADDDGNSYPSIYNLNIYNGNRNQIVNEKQPIQTFLTDGHGTPRLGWGIGKDSQFNYFTKFEGRYDWRPLTEVKTSTDGPQLRPFALAAADNTAYAVGPFEGRDALWSIDLTDQREPRLLFKHPLVDVGDPILQSDRSLLGVRYDVEKPYVWYANSSFRDVIDKLERQYLHEVHEIVDSSADRKTLVIRQSSDVDDGTYFLYNIDENRLQRLGTAYPELERKSLGTMTNILYKAADGTEIPGYLTIPTGADKKNLPLIVMPHDGPVARDSWKFNFLRNFLANRGYAVLQMNYRGSSGFGEKWHLDARKDWNGTIYSDIQDATKWAVSEGIADPQRVCILGRGFGGYEALLSAARAGNAYRCAISVAGISDLGSQLRQTAALGNTELQRAIGADTETLEKNSPLAEAASIGIPVLLVHGTRDWEVQVDQTKAMDSALGKKRHSTVIIKNAGHDFDTQSDRLILLQSVEAFLKENLGPGATN